MIAAYPGFSVDPAPLCSGSSAVRLGTHRGFRSIPAAALLQPEPPLLPGRCAVHESVRGVRMKRLFSSRSCIVDIGFLTSCWPPFTTTGEPPLLVRRRSPLLLRCSGGAEGVQLLHVSVQTSVRSTSSF